MAQIITITRIHADSHHNVYQLSVLAVPSSHWVCDLQLCQHRGLKLQCMCPHLKECWWDPHKRSGTHDHTHHSRPSCPPHLDLHTPDRFYTPGTATRRF